MQTLITPFLWFDGAAEEAARFYTSVFKNSKIGAITRYGEAGPGPNGSVMTVSFQLDGQEFTALNGGPEFEFNHAISFVVHCATQQEVDEYSARLSAGGGEQEDCGWVKDKYGMSWQITPHVLMEMLKEGGAKSQHVMKAMMQMKKLDIEKLQQAHDQK